MFSLSPPPWEKGEENNSTVWPTSVLMMQVTITRYRPYIEEIIVKTLWMIHSIKIWETLYHILALQLLNIKIKNIRNVLCFKLLSTFLKFLCVIILPVRSWEYQSNKQTRPHPHWRRGQSTTRLRSLEATTSRFAHRFCGIWENTSLLPKYCWILV